MARAPCQACRHEAEERRSPCCFGRRRLGRNEMSPLATVPRDMERPDLLPISKLFLDPNDGWAGA